MLYFATTKPYKYCEETKQSFQYISLDMLLWWKRVLSIFLCSDLATLYKYHGAEYLLNIYVTFHEWGALIKKVYDTLFNDAKIIIMTNISCILQMEMYFCSSIVYWNRIGNRMKRGEIRWICRIQKGSSWFSLDL